MKCNHDDSRNEILTNNALGCRNLVHTIRYFTCFLILGGYKFVV